MLDKTLLYHFVNVFPIKNRKLLKVSYFLWSNFEKCGMNEKNKA